MINSTDNLVNVNMNPVSSNPPNMFGDARGWCKTCGAIIKDRPHTCAICGAPFCHKHVHNLALVRRQGLEIVYACLDCIKKDHLQVIDPNHPYYLEFNNKEQTK